MMRGISEISDVSVPRYRYTAVFGEATAPEVLFLPSDSVTMLVTVVCAGKQFRRETFRPDGK